MKLENMSIEQLRDLAKRQEAELLEQQEIAQAANRQAEAARASEMALHDVVKYKRLARGVQNPAGHYPNGPWEDFYACDDVLLALAAPQQHAQAPDLSNIKCWVEDEDGALCEALARAADIKDPDNAFVRLSTVLKLIGSQHAQAAQITEKGKSPLPLTDEQVIGVLHSCGIDTYPSVNGFSALQVSATSVPWVREVVRRCMVLIEAADSRVSGNSQAALSDDLPPLPEPEGTIYSDGYWLAHKRPYRGKFGAVYSAAMMREYGRLCLAASQPDTIPTTVANQAINDALRVGKEGERDAALEEAAKICDRETEKLGPVKPNEFAVGFLRQGTRRCAASIRAAMATQQGVKGGA